MKKNLLKLFLGVFIVLLTISTIYNFNTKDKNNPNSEKQILSELKKTNNFKLENLNRYILYKKYNTNLSYEEITTNVNIGLDKEFYTYIKNAKINKETLVLVNKYEKLNENYIPNNLEEIKDECFVNKNTHPNKTLQKEAKEAFEKLCTDSIKNNTPVLGQSGYRSYQTQKNLYEYSYKTYGKDIANSDTAKPGHSEHQTGLAIDVSSSKEGNMLNFEKTESFKWLIKNAHKYGFILRYNEETKEKHGYIYEPWHYRYVGIKVATNMYYNHKNLTYDEYYYKFIDNN